MVQAGTHAPDNNGVVWNYEGWTITESYDPQGLCSQIIYAGQALSERVVFQFLRKNTPAGVTWKEDKVPGWQEVIRKWHSTEYTEDGLMTVHLVAVLGPILPKDPLHEDTSQVITEYSLSVAISN